MGITLADVQNWQPEQIDEVSQAAAQRARTSGEAAETLRNLSVFGTWKGEAGEAAQQAINQSATTLSLSQKEAFLVAMGAGKAAGDVRKVKNDLQSLLDYANAAPHVQIDLATNTVTPPDTTGWTEEQIAELRAKIEQVENRMVAVLAAAEEADADLARVLTAATGGDPGLPGEQGTNDGQSLQDGQLTPEEMARLEENTTLTPEQQEALVRGDTVLPSSQMEYLNNLSRSLDGKSPAEIRSMIDQMNANGQNGGAVADALQLLGNENITTAGDPAEGVPTQGGMANLPSGIRETFERPTRGIAVPTQGTNEQGNPTIEMPDYEHPFPELDNYRDVAAIVSAGDANLQHGTALDKALLDKSEEVLHGTHNPPYYPWAENVEWTQERIDRRCRTCSTPPDETRWPCTANSSAPVGSHPIPRSSKTCSPISGRTTAPRQARCSTEAARFRPTSPIPPSWSRPSAPGRSCTQSTRMSAATTRRSCSTSLAPTGNRSARSTPNSSRHSRRPTSPTSTTCSVIPWTTARVSSRSMT